MPHPKTEPNDLAAPLDVIWNDQTRETHHGLTKREYFAGLFMAALTGPYGSSPGYSRLSATEAVKSTDDLIAALNASSGEVSNDG